MVSITCIRVHDLERPADIETSTDTQAEGGLHLGFHTADHEPPRVVGMARLGRTMRVGR